MSKEQKLNVFFVYIDGAIYNGYTHNHLISQIFKLNKDDPEKNLKTYVKDPAKNFIRSKFL